MIEGLQPYAEYKESGLPWAGLIPSRWNVKRGKSLFAESQLPVRDGDEIVTCFRDGQVTLRRNRRTSGFMLALYEAGYQGVRRGQLVIHAMDAFAGAIGVSDSNGKCTPEYIVTNPRSSMASASYFALLLRYVAHQGFILVSCPAVRERAPRFRYPDFGDLQMPLPSPGEQAAMVRFLDHANRKIDGFIRAKKRELSLITETLMTVTEESLVKPCATVMRLSTAAALVHRPIDRRAGDYYTRIGLFNRGRGIFHKPPVSGTDLGDSEFFSIEKGDLVISGQFAWEGAVALARDKDKGCIASHRYPILRGREKIISSAGLLAILRTKLGGMLMDHHSRGAAGRNRPLNINTLLKEKIPIPSPVAQVQITNLLEQEYSVAQAVARSIRLVDEYRSRLTGDVVTGKLDVRPAAARLPDLAAAAESLEELETEQEEMDQ
ncbi:MAG: hypothetical protein BGO12_13440 [Verrucomicrobia bacterium 61-8]|nr:restriction endonuclease subunit S [Verrucomicrobiota bacterium]OJV22382.1 MAG: hypothetical protein BGO12_13440 [Verrucomicrobia bacterium 61-8]